MSRIRLRCRTESFEPVMATKYRSWEKVLTPEQLKAELETKALIRFEASELERKLAALKASA